MAGKIIFPSHFDPYAKDLVKRLLVADRTKRLGNLKSGAEDIKRHKWFKDIDWDALLCKSIPAPITPIVRHPGDTRNFEKYPDPTPEDLSSPILDSFNDQFRDF